MPRKPKPSPVDLPVIPQDLLKSLGDGPMTAEAINDLSLAFKKALIERALNGEMKYHLGYPSGGVKPACVANQRNGSGSKTVLTENGSIRIDVPRDREGSFTPLLIPKHERRFTGFDDKIVALYARGMTVREIQGFLQDEYGTEVSPDFISAVTDEVMTEIIAWQARPLEPMYPVVFFDALRVKIREDAVVRNKAVYLALGVLPDGTRDILGLWIEGTEGAKFWLKVFNDLKTRGVNDILIAVTDGLKGMPEALAAVFPATTLQTCIVHLIRNSLNYASWKDRKALAAASTPRLAQKRLRLNWKRLQEGRGGRNSQRSAPHGAMPGIASFRSLRSRRQYAGSFTRPTPSRTLTRNYARSSKTGAISRPTKQQRNSSGWRCAISPQAGAAPLTIGSTL